MKHNFKMLAAAMAAITAMSALSAGASAKVWLDTRNGITYRYSQEDDSCVVDVTEFTGWARGASGNRYYYKDGRRLKNTWLVVNGEKMYYLDKKGVMLKDTSITHKGITYWFDLNGRVMDDNVAEWGITGSANHGKHREGISITISRDKSADANEVTWGEEFRVEKLGEDGKWSEPPYIGEEFGWDDVASYVEAGKEAHRWCDWTYMYGSLEPGSYRLVKVIEHKDPGRSYSRSKLLYIEFEITDTTGHKMFEPPIMTVRGITASEANYSWECVYPDGEGTGADACGLGPLDKDAKMPTIKAKAGEMLPLEFIFTKAPPKSFGINYSKDPYEITVQSWDISAVGNDNARSTNVPVDWQPDGQSIKAVSGTTICQLTAKFAWQDPDGQSAGTMGGTVNYYFCVQAD